MLIKYHIFPLLLPIVLFINHLFMMLRLWIVNDSISKLHSSIFSDINTIFQLPWFTLNLLFYFITLYYFGSFIFHFAITEDIVTIYYLVIESLLQLHLFFICHLQEYLNMIIKLHAFYLL